MNRMPKLRFKEYSGEWEEHELGDIAKFSKGKGIAKFDIHEDGAIECIRYGELYTHYNETINNIVSRTNLNSKELVLSQYNDIIIPASGESQIDIATASCVLKDGVALGGDLNIIKTKQNGVFLSYYLNNKKKLDIAKLAQGISVVHLYSSQLRTLTLNLPNDDEQQKIASFLSAVDSKIDRLTRKKELLEQYKKGVMQKIFSQELRFKADDGSEFSEWEEKNGNLLFESISNKDHNSDLPILAITQEHGAIPRDMIDYQVSVTDKSVETYKIVEIGDFVISLRSFQGGIEYSNYKGICSPAYVILRKRIELNNQFYKHYFKTEKYIKLMNKNIEGIRDGKMISYKQFSDILLPLPSHEEQTKIANFLSAIDTKIDLVAKQLDEVKNFKKGLLQQMFV
ncbi:restriction endonuclease subunit S [Sulfuricurvum sp. MLSB]|uniref:restriction endonuclease subunit S n=1 Tax=Sulfuricurvum sp. MLSB TaxID=1537917 RepID=UPI000A665F33|nr:restriction endonuclease subunit S [Sulfuricurvum sp. MLSB]